MKRSGTEMEVMGDKKTKSKASARANKKNKMQMIPVSLISGNRAITLIHCSYFMLILIN
jgi:hypothetical protein